VADCGDGASAIAAPWIQLSVSTGNGTMAFANQLPLPRL